MKVSVAVAVIKLCRNSIRLLYEAGRFMRIAPALCFFCIASIAAQAQQGPDSRAVARRLYQDGVTLYQRKEYKGAADLFGASYNQDHTLGESLYYLGLTYYELGHEEKAREVYQSIVKNYRGRSIADTAAMALARLDSNERAAESSLPRETWIPYHSKGRWLVVDGAINARATQFIFDTGAERCLFSLEHLRQLGITPPSGPPTGKTLAVGSTEPVPNWTMRVDLKAGRIERKNFPIIVSTISTPLPLLGEDFSKGYEVDVDQSKQAISFKHKGAGTLSERSQSGSEKLPPRQPAMTVDAAGHYVHTVPFVKEGNSLVVTALINGCPTPMIFDTGAESCLFSSASASKCNIALDTRIGAVPIAGAAGKASARVGVINSIKLGPIEKTRMLVPVSDSMASPRPLLGQDFFREWHYTIDSKNNTIRFTR